MKDQIRHDSGKTQWHYIFSNVRALMRTHACWTWSLRSDLSVEMLLSHYLAGGSDGWLVIAFVQVMTTLNDDAVKLNLDSIESFLASVPYAARALTKTYLYGNEKYTRGNFKLGAPVCSYIDAAYRHLLAIRSGELSDQESKLPHLAHVAWNIWQTLDQSVERDNRLKG